MENITLSANLSDTSANAATETSPTDSTEENDKEASNATAKEDNKVEVVEKKLKKRTFRVPLKVRTSHMLGILKVYI